jgi:MYXO-CTERM domain-containing protein
MTVQHSELMTNGGDRGSFRVLLPAVLDDATTMETGPELRRVATDAAHDCIVLDARHLTSICPAGLGLLAAVGLLARRRGAQVKAVNCNPRIAGLLRIARLDASAADSSDASELSTDDDWTPWWSSAAANA